MKETFVCESCGKKYLAYPSRRPKSGHTFCSVTCVSYWRKKLTGDKAPNYTGGKSLKKNCKECGKSFSVYPSRESEGEVKFCGKKCMMSWRSRSSVVVKCVECGEKFSATKYDTDNGHGRFCSRACVHSWLSANKSQEKSHAWRGGISSDRHIIRESRRYAKWRREVFERDKYACVRCGKTGRINAHHKKRLSRILDDLRRQHSLDNVVCVASQCTDLWDISNGETLCEPCHKLEHKNK